MNRTLHKLSVGIRASSDLPRDVGRTAALLRSKGRALAYCGYAGRGNAGDDAMFLAHKRSLAGTDLLPTPIIFDDLLLPAARRTGRQMASGVLVGGGTLVGRPEWLKRMAGAHRNVGGFLAFTGVGVEDPDFVGGKGASTSLEHLSQWAPLLEQADHLTVRGPRSAEVLKMIGIDTQFISDPALLLGPDVPQFDLVRDKCVGLNIARVEDQYSGSKVDLMEEAIRACKRLVGLGWTIRLLSFEHGDLQIARRIAQQVPVAQVVETFDDVDLLCDEISQCSVVVGQRLHAIVLATAFAVPSVALDYRPKCRDFLASIGRSGPLLSSATATGNEIVDAVLELNEDRERDAIAISEAVQTARIDLMKSESVVAELMAASH